ASYSAGRNQLSREYLRNETARGEPHHFCERRRLLAGRPSSRRVPSSRPILRPDKESHLHLFWRGASSARRVCASHVRTIVRTLGGHVRAPGGEGASTRDLCLHRGTAILHFG